MAPLPPYNRSGSIQNGVGSLDKGTPYWEEILSALDHHDLIPSIPALIWLRTQVLRFVNTLGKEEELRVNLILDRFAKQINPHLNGNPDAYSGWQGFLFLEEITAGPIDLERLILDYLNDNTIDHSSETPQSSAFTPQKSKAELSDLTETNPNEALKRRTKVYKSTKSDKGKSASPSRSTPAADTSSELFSVSPEELFEIVETEYYRLLAQLETLSGTFDDDAINPYQNDLDRLNLRLNAWKSQFDSSARHLATDRLKYRIDIRIGLEILFSRINRLSAKLFRAPHHEILQASMGLDSVSLPLLGPGDDLEDDIPLSYNPYLKNYDLGYGKLLRLRPHQIEALDLIKGRLLSLLSLQDEGVSPHLLSLQDNIVMPVGSGKSRLMIASFAAAIETGLFQLGDKLIIVNHTNQIHAQNLDEIKRLNPYFKKRFGRDLKISEYKAAKKDCSGDVVVISVPSVSGTRGLAQLQKALALALGKDRKIAVVAVDEVHHLGLSKKSSQKSWQTLMQGLRAISPHFYRLGFTATRTGAEGNTLVNFTEYQMRQRGIGPRTFYKPIQGIVIEDKIKSGQALSDAGAEREITSVFLKEPIRNQRIFAALDHTAIRQESLSPSQKKRLKPVLIFGNDIKHADMMGKAYQAYFKSDQSEDLGKRNLVYLGAKSGKITKAELQAAIADYQAGKNDGIVLLVSGRSHGSIPDILAAVQAGAVETLLSVDKFLEGANLHMFTHQVGARATFSRIKKAQERGRINRRSPGSVTESGYIKDDSPKIIYDVLDDYRDEKGRSLVFYHQVMGLRDIRLIEEHEVLDTLYNQRTSQITHAAKASYDQTSPQEKAPVKKREHLDAKLQPLVDQLWKILQEEYAGDSYEMSLDLGVDEDRIKELLAGQTWGDRHQMGRLATLLYQDRNTFIALYDSYEHSSTSLKEADYQILRSALMVYEEVSGKSIAEGIAFRAPMPWGEEEIVIPSSTQNRIANMSLGDMSYRNLLRGLLTYFYMTKQDDAYAEKSDKIKAAYDDLMEYALSTYEKPIPEKLGPAQRDLLLNLRKGVALRFGGYLPSNTGESLISPHLPRLQTSHPLNDYLHRAEIRLNHNYTQKKFYQHLKTLLAHLGYKKKTAKSQIVAAIFEENNWDYPKDVKLLNARETLLFELRSRVALQLGGDLSSNKGSSKLSDQLSILRPDHALRIYLKTGKIKDFTAKNTAKKFYSELKTLLEALGMNHEIAEKIIVAAIFEENNWKFYIDLDKVSAQERLLFELRYHTALQFGGKLPSNSGNSLISSDLPVISKNHALRIYIRDGLITLNNATTPAKFYEHVRLLSIALGYDPQIANERILAAIFEENNWDYPKDLELLNARETLLFELRYRVALQFGGKLPSNSGASVVFPDLPDFRHDHPFRYYLKRGKFIFSDSYPPLRFNHELKLLLEALGMPSEEAQTKVDAVIPSHSLPQEILGSVDFPDDTAPADLTRVKRHELRKFLRTQGMMDLELPLRAALRQNNLREVQEQLERSKADSWRAFSDQFLNETGEQAPHR